MVSGILIGICIVRNKDDFLLPSWYREGACQ